MWIKTVKDKIKNELKASNVQLKTLQKAWRTITQGNFENLENIWLLGNNIYKEMRGGSRDLHSTACTIQQRKNILNDGELKSVHEIHRNNLFLKEAFYCSNWM